MQDSIEEEVIDAKKNTQLTFKREKKSVPYYQHHQHFNEALSL